MEPIDLLSSLQVVSDYSPERPFLIGIDGRSCVGKSALADWLARGLGGEVAIVDLDDFYAGGEPEAWAGVPAGETLERICDYERVLAELIRPLKAGQTASWQAFDWDNMGGFLKELGRVEPRGIVIIEGTYSCAPQLSGYLDATVLAAVSEPVRAERMLKREGEAYVQEYAAYWNPVESYYFETVRPSGDFHFVVDTSSEPDDQNHDNRAETR